MKQLTHNPHLFAVLGLSLLLTACSDGGSSSRKKNKTGATVVSAACVNGTGAATSCQRLRVNTPGNQSIEAELQVTDPDPNAVPLGTVVLSSGGVGDKFYADNPGGDQVVAALSQAGWKVVDRRWDQGWFTTDESIKSQSQRYAVLLDWINTNLHEGGQLAAVGNASGASEIAYTMTTWDGSALLDNIVLNAGPAMTRLDYLCLSPIDPDWDTQCSTIVPPGSTTCAPVCTRTSSPVCPFVSPDFTPAELAEDSILHSEATLDFGSTLVHVGVGQDDCTAAIPQALLFTSSIASSVRVEYVPNTAHGIYETTEGLNSILAALMEGALPVEIAPPAVAERITILEESGDVTVIERAGN